MNDIPAIFENDDHVFEIPVIFKQHVAEPVMLFTQPVQQGLNALILGYLHLTYFIQQVSEKCKGLECDFHYLYPLIMDILPLLMTVRTCRIPFNIKEIHITSHSIPEQESPCEQLALFADILDDLIGLNRTDEAAAGPDNRRRLLSGSVGKDASQARR